jgi:hypothetical protein
MSTLRNTLVDYIVDKISAMNTPDYTQGYRDVTRDPISQEHITKLAPGEACVGVYDIDEEKHISFSNSTCQLQLVLEFYYKPKVGQSKSRELNRLMGDLEACMRIDYGQGGNAINTIVLSNSIDIDGIYDKIINGSIKFEVTYRHGVYDPRINNC